jgi:transcriptional regulator with XRE-family HTH domain
MCNIAFARGEATVAEHIGSRIIERRKALGMSQLQLAQTAGIAQGYLSQIESGQRRPSLDTLRKLRTGLALEDDVWVAWVDAA